MSDSDTPLTDAALEYTHCSCDICDGTRYAPADFARALERRLRELERERDSPEIRDFICAIQREAEHQRARWGSEHDAGKAPEDWLWLVAYLATKATQAHRYNDHDKYLHHIITCAAVCLNWHANASGADTRMRPGTEHALLAAREEEQK